MCVQICVCACVDVSVIFTLPSLLSPPPPPPPPPQEQYVVVHDALLEEAVCGITHFPVPQMSHKIHELAQTKDETGQNGFESQFKVCI